jgi:hypothetical protein
MKPRKTNIYFQTILLGSLLVAISGGFFVSLDEAEAAAGINKKISFQGKVVNTDGTNVSNASYTFLFCIYTVANPSSACTAGANNDAIWRESKSITTTDGVFQTDLGSVTSLPGSVDFNTDNIYLGVNFNSNGQMTPLIQFTAVPYAFNAEKVSGLSVTNTTGTLTVPNGETISFGGSFTTTASNDLTLTTGGATNVTLPTTGTLATLAGSEEFTNKTIGSTGLIFSGASADITTTAGEGLSIDSGTTGTIDIGTGANAKTITFGNATTTTTVNINSGTGGINFQAAGTGVTDVIQVGGGGAGSSTPDYFALDVYNTTGDPATAGFEGAMYYNTTDNKFRCYQGSAWTDCISGGTTYTEGNYIDITGASIAFDPTELGTVTWYNGTAATDIVWTFDGETNDGTFNYYEDEDAFSFTNSSVGIGTTAPVTAFELSSTASADNIFTLTSATDDYDPLIKWRTGSGSPTVKFTLGVDGSDSDKFKIYSGDGLSGDEFTIDTTGVTTISQLKVGAQSFEDDAGAVVWTDMNVTSASSDNTVESYVARLDGTDMLTIYALVNGSSGAIDTKRVLVGAAATTGTTDPAVFGLDVKSDANDPTGFEGAMYYSNNTNKFRCYQDSAWTDCIGGGTTYTEGNYIDITGASIAFDPTELGTVTWYNGTAATDIVWTFDGETNDGTFNYYEDEDAFSFTNSSVGIGTTAPTSGLELYNSGANPVFTITGANATDYDPQIAFRTDASPTVKFSLGVDAYNDYFKIYSGDGIGDTSEFMIDSTGVTTISQLQVGAQKFEADGGVLSWVDMDVTGSATDNTVESYSAQIDGANMLTVSALSDGLGSIDNKKVQVGAGTNTSLPVLFGLDVRATTGDGAEGFEGAMYYNTTDNKFRCYQGSAWTDCIGGSGSVADDSLDFNKFEDTLDLDAANLTLNQTTYTWTQNFTGTTTTGYTYNADSLTTGTGMAIASTSTAGDGSKLLSLTRTGTNGTSAKTNYGLYSTIANTNGTSGTNYAGYFGASGANMTNIGGYFTASGGTNNYGLLVAAGSVGIGTTAPVTAFELYSATAADNIFTLTANTTANDPLIKLRSAATSLGVKFSLGIDTSDSEKFKIDSGDGLGTTADFVIDSTGVTTIASAKLGAQSFPGDGGILSWVDMSVSSDSVDNTVMSYSAQVDSNVMLTVSALSNGSGGIDNKKVQIGAGTDTTLPVLLGLDVRNTTGDPSEGFEGAMYYNTADNAFRCYVGSAWAACGGGGTLTPWASDIDADGYDLNDLSNILFRETTGAPTGTDVGLYRDNAGDLSLNVLTGKAFNVAVNGTDEYNFSSTGIGFNSNNITGLGTGITATAGLTITSTTNTLTLDSGNNILTLAAGDTTLQRTAAGTYTFDLVDGSNTTLALTNSGAGTAGLRVDGLVSCDSIDTDGSGNLVCGTDAGASSSPFGTSGGVITKSTAGDFLSLRYGDAGDTQLIIENTTSTTIPTVDAMQIDLTGNTTGIVTDGADGLQIAMEVGNGTTNTNSGINISFTPVNTPSGDEIFNAINIGNLTASAATETGLKVGTGWDYDIQFVDATPTIRLGATDNTGQLVIVDSSGNNIFEVKDLNTNFGATAEAGGFADRNSYFYEEFIAERADDTASTAISWGDHNEWTVLEQTATSNDCIFSTVNDTINGIGRINTADASTQCLAYTGINGSTANAHLIFDADNLPVIYMKLRPSIAGAAEDFWMGIGDSAAVSANPPNNGIYFTNNDSSTWTGVTRSGSTSTPVTCSGATIDTTNFALLKIEVVSTSSVKFYVDTNASNGATWSYCGESTTNIPTATLAGMLKTAATTDEFNFDVDYYRVWQDDAPSSSVSSAPMSSSPLMVEAAPSAFEARSALVDLMTANEDLEYDPSARLDTQVLYASEGIVAPEVTTRKLSTDTIASGLTSDIAIVLAKDGKLTLGSDPKRPSLTFDTAGNATFAGTLRAGKIEGLDVIGDRVTALEQTMTGLQGQVSTLLSSNDSPARDQSTASDSVISSAESDTATSDIENSTDAIDAGALEILFAKGGFVVEGDAEFLGRATFAKTAMFNRDAAGFAVVPKGAKRVDIVFETPYEKRPIVNATLTGVASIALEGADTETLAAFAGVEQEFANAYFAGDVKYLVVNRSERGFTILLNAEAPDDLEFSWSATAILGATISRGTPEIVSVDTLEEGMRPEEVSPDMPISATPTVGISIQSQPIEISNP